MKKFFKLKLDRELESETKGVPSSVPDPPLQPNAEKHEKKSELQPPLPVDPPPTEFLPLNKQVKRELDTEPQSNSDKSDILSDSKEMEQKPKKKVDICRDYIRGTCKRTGCKFAHKNDVTQEDLYGVYVFCREFQSKVCTRARCKYVHASVFEEQEYYRSRYLPPHTFSHLNNNHVLLPPPPPPPEEPAVNFAIPPPPLQNELEKQAHSMVNWVPTTTLKKQFPVPLAQPVPITQPVPEPPAKRDWNIVELFNRSDCIDANEPVAKKCKQCDTTEFRYQYNKKKVEKMRLAKEEMNKKIILLQKNSEKLNNCIQSLLINTLAPKLSGNLVGLDNEKSLSGLVSALSNINDMACDDK